MVMTLDKVQTKHSSGYNYWTEKEKDIIRLRYNSHNTKDIQNDLVNECGSYRTLHAIQRQAKDIGVAYKNPANRIWDKRELDILHSMLGKNNYYAISKAIGTRDKNAVKRYCHRHGLTFMGKDGWYNCKEVSMIIGRSEYYVQSLLRCGRIIGQKLASDNPVDIHYQWRITEKELKKFICKYPMELTGRNCDIVQIVSMLAPKFKRK